MNAPTVAVFTASPLSLDPLDLEGELRSIEGELEAVGLGSVFRFECQRAATPTMVQRALLMDRPQVVQFSGHGRGGGRPRVRRMGSRDLVPEDEPAGPTGIMMHGDDRGAVKVVSGEALGDVLGKAGASVRLVFLNACYSAEQAEAIAEHVDFVIGVSGAISDDAAKVFATALYRALAFGRTVHEAFDLGVNALMLEGLEADRKLAVLRSRTGVDPRTVTLVAPPKNADGKAWDVFITYAQADREQVHRLAVELHRRQLRVFFDEWEVGLGEQVSRRLDDGVRGSNHGLVAVSSTTMTQPWVEAAYGALLDKAVTQGRRLIPVLMGDGDAQLPPFLRARRWVDLRGKSDQAYRRDVELIALALRGQRPGPPPR